MVHLIVNNPQIIGSGADPLIKLRLEQLQFSAECSPVHIHVTISGAIFVLANFNHSLQFNYLAVIIL